MKVICAGASRTGTKSMVVALRHLGYNVFDFEDHLFTHSKQWWKILTYGSTKEDFYEMYKDIDAVVDLPSYYYWKEIADAFPDAKIILMTREPNSWVKSWKVVCDVWARRPLFVQLTTYVLPTPKLFSRLAEAAVGVVFGMLPHQFNKPWNRRIIVNEEIAKRRYEEHNARVLQLAPKDKLLVYEVSQGWEPMCKFLGKEIPEVEFPHLNKGARVLEKVRLKEMEKQIMKEMFIFTALLVAGISMILYFFFM